jgi:hypothetical protein
MKHSLKRKGPGSYITTDGWFEIYRLHGRGCSKWQARATDGREVFSYTLFGKQRNSSVYNGDTLNECREAIENTY